MGITDLKKEMFARSIFKQVGEAYPSLYIDSMQYVSLVLWNCSARFQIRVLSRTDGIFPENGRQNRGYHAMSRLYHRAGQRRADGK